jgi:hypothetical protein
MYPPKACLLDIDLNPDYPSLPGIRVGMSSCLRLSPWTRTVGSTPASEHLLCPSLSTASERDGLRSKHSSVRFPSRNGTELRCRGSPVAAHNGWLGPFNATMSFSATNGYSLRYRQAEGIGSAEDMKAVTVTGQRPRLHACVRPQSTRLRRPAPGRQSFWLGLAVAGGCLWCRHGRSAAHALPHPAREHATDAD